MSKPLATPALTADAIGFIGRRKDRPERLALFHRDGAVSCTFGMDETLDELRGALAGRGMSVDAEGVVRRVG